MLDRNSCDFGFYSNLGHRSMLSSKMIFSISTCCLLLVILSQTTDLVTAVLKIDRYPDYKDHHCNRDCNLDMQQRTCEYDFTIEYYYTLTQACHNCPYNITDCFRPHCIAADGVSRGLLTVNRMMPGPSIRVCENDNIVVNVQNNMEGGEGTAIHWHGILQTETPHMDGVSMLTQCPIHQYSKFQYRFKADTPGTHFWHAHSGLQRADGVYGAIIVRQKKTSDPQSHLYDEDLPEHIIQLNDWIEEMSAVRFSGHHHSMTDHSPSTILINGRGTKRAFRSSQSSPHSGHGGHMMSTMDMAHASPTGIPMTQHINNGDSDFNNNLDAMPSMVHNADMDIVHEHHRMKRGADSMPTMRDSDHMMHDMDSSSDTTYTPQAVFEVAPMKRYRFRVISNGVNNCPIQFSIDNHTMTMIAADGTPFRPLEVESFNIFAGERYDFVLYTNNHVGNYWIRTHGLADCYFKHARQTAILRYKGTMPMKPRESVEYAYFERNGMRLNPFNQNSGPSDVNVVELESVIKDGLPLKRVPDRKLFLAFDFNMVDNYRFNDPDLYPLSNMIGHAHHMGSPQINGITHKMPSSPPLTQYSKYLEKDFCNEDTISKNCKKEFCECIHRVKVKLGQEVEMVLVDEGKMQDNNHPMHLHGYKFKVIAMGKLGNSTSIKHIKRLDNMGLIKRKLINPISKDTVTVPDGGYTIIRFHATNPGFWLFHCHIAFHMEMGMNMIIQVGEVNEMLPPPRLFPTCGDWTPEAILFAKNDEEWKQKQISCPPVSNSLPTTQSPSIPPLHEVYLDGIQQTTDVNFTDVTLHYALLLWMTGRRNQTGDLNVTTVEHNSQHMSGPPSHKLGRHSISTRTHPITMPKDAKLPLFKIKSAKPLNIGVQAARSSIIELSKLPKMMAPAHNVERIVTNGHDSRKGKLVTHKKIRMRGAIKGLKPPGINIHINHKKPAIKREGSKTKAHAGMHNRERMLRTTKSPRKQQHQKHPPPPRKEHSSRVNGHSMHTVKRRSNNDTEHTKNSSMHYKHRLNNHRNANHRNKVENITMDSTYDKESMNRDVTSMYNTKANDLQTRDTPSSGVETENKYLHQKKLKKRKIMARNNTKKNGNHKNNTKHIVHKRKQSIQNVLHNKTQEKNNKHDKMEHRFGHQRKVRKRNIPV